MSVNSIFSVSNTVSMLARALHFINANTPPGKAHSSDNYEHEELHQTFNLTPGDRIEVSRISGPVEVESTDGDTAEVHIIRSAKVKTDLAWRKIRVEQTPTGLVIEPVDDEARRPRQARVNHYVMLKLPRQVSFISTAVSGSISIGAIDGTVQISGTSGSVSMKETGGATDISGVSGSVILNITRLNERGLRVSGVSGTVELHVSDELNAELSITDLTGKALIDIPNSSLQEVRPSSYHGRLGQGGPRISVSGVTGNVVLRRG
jgi:hypothetical protein